jgi:tetratricopeptide (TPR) repeat protein
MKNRFHNLMARRKWRRRAASLQDAGAVAEISVSREASWSAPVLWRFGITVLLATLACAGNIFAADVNADFAAANKLYALGKFPEAANLYEKILQTGAQSPALLFNYANAEFKAGNLGKAIAAYRRARLLSPHDADIRANLDFVRHRVQSASVRESRWEGWLGQLTLNEWTLLAAVGFWLTLLLFAARQIQPVLALRLRSVTRLAVMLTLCAGAALAVQAAEHFRSSVAVVTNDEATARSGPFDDAQVAFKANDGAELSVLDRHDGWVQVADGTGKIGWMNKTQVGILPGA